MRYVSLFRGLPQEVQTLCKNKAVKAAVLASMNAEGKAAKLNSFEHVKSCCQHPGCARGIRCSHRCKIPAVPCAMCILTFLMVA